MCENYSKAAQDFPAQSLNPPSAGSHRPDHSSSVTSEVSSSNVRVIPTAIHVIIFRMPVTSKLDSLQCSL